MPANIPIKRFGPLCLLAFSLLLGAYLRFHQIGKEPLWLDEAWSYFFSRRTFAELWTVVPKFESNPPLYYLLLKGWSGLFGTSEACLRSLSAAMSVICIPLVFLIGRALGDAAEGNWLGAMAALMVAVSPLQVQYAQEARTYATLTCATTLTLGAFLWIVRHPDLACGPLFHRVPPREGCTGEAGRSRLSPWWWAVLAAGATLWLHDTAVLFLVPLVLVVMVRFFPEFRTNPVLLGNFTLAALAVLLLWAPRLTTVIAMAGGSFPIPPPGLQFVVHSVAGLLIGDWIRPVFEPLAARKLAIVLVLALLAGGGLYQIGKRSGKSASLLVFAAITGPVLLELAASYALTPVFLPRTLVYLSIPFYLCLAAGVTLLRDWRLRGLLLGAVVLALLKLTHSYFTEFQKEPWDRVVGLVSRQANRDVVLLVPRYLALPFSYYEAKNGKGDYQVVPLPARLPTALLERERVGDYDFKRIRVGRDDIPTVHQVASGKSPVWLITRCEELFDKDRIVYRALSQQMHLDASWRVGDIMVMRFI